MVTTFETGVWRRYIVVLEVEPAPEETPSADNVILREWAKIKTVLIRVLRYFPEARDAVVKGLDEISPDDPALALVT